MELLLLLALLLGAWVGKPRFPRAFGDALVDTFAPGTHQSKPDKDARIPWRNDWLVIETKLEAIIETPPAPTPTPRVLPWAALPPRHPAPFQPQPVVAAQPSQAKARTVAPPPPAARTRVIAPVPPPPAARSKLPPISRSPLWGREYAAMPRTKSSVA